MKNSIKTTTVATLWLARQVEKKEVCSNPVPACVFVFVWPGNVCVLLAWGLTVGVQTVSCCNSL